MLLRIDPPTSALPPVLYQLSFPLLPYSPCSSSPLPLPPAWRTTYAAASAFSLPLGPLHTADRASWLVGILTAVTFDLARNNVRVEYDGGEVMLLSLPAECRASLSAVLADVQASASLAASESRSRAAAAKSPSAPSTPSQIFSSFLSALLPASASAVESARLARARAPSRILRCRARAGLVDAYRRWVIPFLLDEVGCETGWLEWRARLELRKGEAERAMVEQELQAIRASVSPSPTSPSPADSTPPSLVASPSSSTSSLSLPLTPTLASAVPNLPTPRQAALMLDRAQIDDRLDTLRQALVRLETERERRSAWEAEQRSSLEGVVRRRNGLDRRDRTAPARTSPLRFEVTFSDEEDADEDDLDLFVSDAEDDDLFSTVPLTPPALSSSSSSSSSTASSTAFSSAPSTPPTSPPSPSISTPSPSILRKPTATSPTDEFDLDLDLNLARRLRLWDCASLSAKADVDEDDEEEMPGLGLALGDIVIGGGGGGGGGKLSLLERIWT